MKLKLVKIVGVFFISSLLCACASGREKAPIVQACSGENIGDACGFTSRRGDRIQGACQRAPKNSKILICKPERTNQSGRDAKNKRPSNNEKSANTDCDCKIERGVLYKDSGTWDSKYSKLDVYYRDSSEKKPLIVFVHGGGWVKGDKSDVTKNPNTIKFFIDKGYVVASVNFRLADKNGTSKVKYTHQLEDIASSIRWLSDNARQYGSLEGQFILVGFSSGAHLVSLLATDTSYLQKEGIPIDSIRGVTAWDVPAYDVPLALKTMRGSSLERAIDFNKKLFGNTKEEQMKASPIYYVNNSKMPFLLVSVGKKGDKPQTVTKVVSKSFKDALIKAGHQASHVHYKDSGHIELFLEFAKEGGDSGRVMSNFLDSIK